MAAHPCHVLVYGADGLEQHVGSAVLLLEPDGGQGRRFMALLMENLEEPALFLAG